MKWKTLNISIRDLFCIDWWNRSESNIAKAQKIQNGNEYLAVKKKQNTLCNTLWLRSEVANTEI